VFQFLPENKEKIVPLIRERIEITHEIKGRPLTIPCSFKFGSNWGEMKEIKNNNERLASKQEA
jgi:hypothetical protein